MQLAHRLRLAPAQRHAQIQQPQHAVLALVQVGRLDVAVDHALAVQPAQGLGGLGGGTQGLLHGELLTTVQLLLQGFAGVPVVQQVKGGARPAIRQALMKVNQVIGRTAGLHAGGQPGFMCQHGALLRVVRPCGVQGLQRIQRLAGNMAHLVEQVDAAVGHQRRHAQAVDHFPHLHQARRNRQALCHPVDIGKAGIQQAKDPHDDGGDVVLASCGQRGIDQVLAGQWRAVGCLKACQFL